MSKDCGILLHISSLPSQYGIGDLGPKAYRFADWLHQHGQKYWQLLPLSYCGYGNSPYNPLSTFSSNPYLISLDMLAEDGWVDRKDLKKCIISSGSRIDYQHVYSNKDDLFAKAVKRYIEVNDIESYIEANGTYLKPFVTFFALTGMYSNSSWYAWDSIHKRYSDDLYHTMLKTHKNEMIMAAALQSIFDDQYRSLKNYVNSLGISIIGDMPLYVSYDSADVWSNRDIFSIDNDGNRIKIAGVPPDAFSEEGQLWGNPVYNWEKLQERNFDWFLDRIGKALSQYDYLRLDHFIGYVNYWEIDAHSDNAIDGRWIKAHSRAFFDALTNRYGKEKIIAEDLGILTDEVCNTRDYYGFPGMIILQFCFDERVPNTNQFPSDKIIYSGTHDNNTTRGWYEEYIKSNPTSMENLTNYLNYMGFIKDAVSDSAGIHLQIIEAAYSSPCKTAIIPFQDVLGLDQHARMNLPGTALGNWEWQLRDSDKPFEQNQYLKDLVHRYRS